MFKNSEWCQNRNNSKARVDYLWLLVEASWGYNRRLPWPIFFLDFIFISAEKSRPIYLDFRRTTSPKIL